MSERDYSKQVARRQRIRSTGLVVGVDVGKAYNAVGFMNKEGKILGSCAKVYNSREGFEQFMKMVEDLKAQYGLKDVLIGMEPTGHYWRKLAYFAKEHGYEVRFIRTTALKHHRELDESASAKSDQRDALTIMNITREGKYIDTVVEDGGMRHDPQESDSGYRVSRKFISKKGRWLLRKHLFLMSMRVVVLSRYFQEYYRRKLQTKNRFGQLPRKKEILCAVAIK
jgi:transposase